MKSIFFSFVYMIIVSKDCLDWYLQSVWFFSPVCIFHLSVWLPQIRETSTCGLQGWGKVNRKLLYEYNMYYSAVDHLHKKQNFLLSILKRSLFNDLLKIVYTIMQMLPNVDLIWFEHIFIVQNYNWDWAQVQNLDCPLPIQMYYTVKILYTQDVRSTDHMTLHVVYTLSLTLSFCLSVPTSFFRLFLEALKKWF